MSARTLAVAGLTLCAAVVLPGAPGAAEPGPSAATPESVIADPNVDVGAPALSFSGRYVAYLAIQRGQTIQQLRRTDLDTGGTRLLNPSSRGGVAVGNYSRPPVISGDGTRVAYSTNASDLVAADDNTTADAFVRIVPAQQTRLASVASDGTSGNGAVGMVSMSQNGRYAVFTSTATDLIPGSTTPNPDVFRRDLATGTTTQVTVRPNGSPVTGPGSVSTDVSWNGNLVAFASFNAQLVQGDDDSESDLFLRNMSTGTTRLVSTSLPAGANPGGVVLSPNGVWISTRWDDGSLNLTRVATGVSSTVTANGYALHGSFSSRLGRFVYMSGGLPYVRDLGTGVDTAIPVPSGGFVTAVCISGNGRFAAYDWVPDDGSASRILRVAL